MSKADSEGLEKAIQLLKEITITKSGCAYEIALFQFGEYAETALQELKRLQEENTEYKKQLDLDYVRENYISKYKIREKIEEHNK